MIFTLGVSDKMSSDSEVISIQYICGAREKKPKRVQCFYVLNAATARSAAFGFVTRQAKLAGYVF